MTKKHPLIALFRWMAAHVAILSLLSGCGAGGGAAIDKKTRAINALNIADLGTTTLATSPGVVSEANYAYVPNHYSNQVVVFRMDELSGELSYVGSTPAGIGPVEVVIAPSGKHAYVPNGDSNNISIYEINPQNGSLVSIGLVASTGQWPLSLSIDASGNFAYVANFVSNNISIFSINQSTGALKSIGDITTGINPRHIVLEPSGRYLYVANWGSSNISIYSIDQNSGLLSQVGYPLNVAKSPFSITGNRVGNNIYMTDFLSVSGEKSVSLLKVDQSSGLLIDSGSGVSAGGHPMSLAFDPTGKFAYVPNSLNGLGGNSVSAFSVDSTTGVLGAIACDCGKDGYPSGINPTSAVVDPTGSFLYVTNATSNDIFVYSISRPIGSLKLKYRVPSAGLYPMGISFSKW